MEIDTTSLNKPELIAAIRTQMELNEPVSRRSVGLRASRDWRGRRPVVVRLCDSTRPYGTKRASRVARPVVPSGWTLSARCSARRWMIRTRG